MKFRVIIFFLILSLISSYQSKSQDLNIYATANLGISKITTYDSESNIEDRPAISYSFGFNIEKHLNKVLIFNSGLRWINMRNKEFQYDVPLVFQPFLNGSFRDTIGSLDDVDVLIINNIAIPVTVGVRINKFCVNLGFMFQYNISMSSKNSETGIVREEPYSYSSKSKNIGYKNFDYGNIVEMVYHINNRFAINSSLYLGRRNISTRSNRDEYPFKLRFAHLGINYSILKK